VSYRPVSVSFDLLVLAMVEPCPKKGADGAGAGHERKRKKHNAAFKAKVALAAAGETGRWPGLSCTPAGRFVRCHPAGC
jgi:hypothetical protein